MLKPKRLNQLAIAKATGVSRATVSLVLRGGLGSSEETKAKVIAAAEKMGYRPNALVHSIRSGKSRSMGILVPPHDTYWKDVCYGIHDRMVEANHLPLFLWNSQRQGEPASDYALKQIHRLLDRWVDGVILSPEFSNHYARHLQEFERRNIPLVVIDHSIPELLADRVGSDEAQIAQLIVSHLASRGHRSFLILTGPEKLGWSDERLHYFREELDRIPGSKQQTLRMPLDETIDVAGQIAGVLEKDSSITAALAATDAFARQARAAASLLSWNVPHRLSITGVGNLNYGCIMSPPLTTVDQDGYQVGQKAAQVALERSSGILSGEHRRFTVPVHLIVRGSSGSVL